MNLKNKKIIVVGSARSGIAAAKFLIKKGALVTMLDKDKSVVKNSAAKKLINLGVKYQTGKHILSNFIEAKLIILSPGVSHKIAVIRKAEKRGIPIIGELEFASTFINKPIIGVTGTNGKTTTVMLIEKMLLNSYKKVFLGGNTGLALTECLSKLKDIEIVIAEISSFQLDTIKNFKPATSILLNIANDHMNRYSNYKEYANSKFKIFLNQSKNNIAIFNKEDKTIQQLIASQKLTGIQRPFSIKPVENGAQIFDNSILIFQNKIPLWKFDLSKSQLKGSHNRENIAAAIIAALAEGGNISGIQSAINNFKPPNHRIEIIKNLQGIQFVNDSKATNIHATISALGCFDIPIILILGGQSKNNDFRTLIPYLHKKVKKIIAMGECRKKIKSSLSPPLEKNNLITVKTLEDAIIKALKFAKPGYTILLSPACSSFDQFKNYKKRGQKFKEIVEKLII